MTIVHILLNKSLWTIYDTKCHSGTLYNVFVLFLYLPLGNTEYSLTL